MTKGDARLVLPHLLDAFELPTGRSFEPLHDGVDILRLYGPDPHDLDAVLSEPSAAFVRYRPGAAVPLHRHTGYEHIFVLDGSQADEHGSYDRGSCIINPPGSAHSVTSEKGCLVLAIWDHPIELL